MPKLLVQVCGDPAVDWLIVRNENLTVSGGARRRPGNHPAPEMRLSSQPGGAALILQLLQEMIPPELAEVAGSGLDAGMLQQPLDGRGAATWTVWRACPEEGRSKPPFRLFERYECEHGRWDYGASRLTGRPDLLVIADSGLGFRGATEGWPEALERGAEAFRPQQVILKLAQYEGGQVNPLMDRLYGLGLASRTVILTSVGDLRAACPERIGVSLSWERLFEEVVAAVHSPGGPFAGERGDLLCQRVIVTIGASGAVIDGRDCSTLIFDRSGQEGDFARHIRGRVVGGSACVLGALAAAWVNGAGSLDWAAAASDGIALARLLHLEGYEVVAEDDAERLRFPCGLLAQAYRERPKRAGSKRPGKVWDLGIFRDAGGLARREGGRWSILEETVGDAGRRRGSGEMKAIAARGSRVLEAVYACARRVVEEGPRAALPDAPVEMIGNWSSADRGEIEGVRSVYNAAADYLRQGAPQPPLCVAVFGPPGAGKSFVIREIAGGLGIARDARLSFNLAGFASPRDLTEAFHQIRDLYLRGRIPLVLWDEFDACCEGAPLGWLRHFLAPMQDGEFTGRGRTHPLGSGIYAFAGAGGNSFAEFCAGAGEASLSAKKPDFISRLRAYIDVRGPNGNPNTVEDRMYTIRRAFLLHRCLEVGAPHIKQDGRFQVAPGVLDALLKATSYRHGARSLEAIVGMSSLHGKVRYDPSSLPPEQILGMHVDAGEFNMLARLGHRELLRVGITGHIRLDPGRMAGLEAGIARAAAFIASRFPERFLTVFSPLAIGADRLAARILLRDEAARLIVVLPVPLDDYLNDFGRTDEHCLDYDGAELRQEFRYWLAERAIETIAMPRAATRGEAYLRAGRFIVEHSDVMMAIWDGREAQGRGGTGEIVALTRKLGKPICHIWAGNYKQDETRRTDVGARHGRFRHMNFPGYRGGRWAGE